MQFDVNALSVEKQQLLLEYLYAELRALRGAFPGEAHPAADGAYHVQLVAEHSISDRIVRVDWSFTKDREGKIEYIEAAPRGEAISASAFEREISVIWQRVLTAAVAEVTERRFHRHTLYYVGVRLDGEYWLRGLRVAPGCDEDALSQASNGERPIFLDRNVDAIDEHSSRSLTHERALQTGARLSLLLDVGVYASLGNHVWILNPSGSGSSLRGAAGFMKSGTTPLAMPEKGTECRLGEYAGSVLELDINHKRSASGLLCFPVETRSILRGLDKASVGVRDAFDRAARLYQVALVAGLRYPTVRLAYQVAAVESLSQHTGGSFSGFVRHYLGSVANADQVKAVYDEVRSPHFHGGSFPLGDFLSVYVDVADQGHFERSSLIVQGHILTRGAIMRWALDTLANGAD